MAKIRCPYCLTEHNASELDYFCNTHKTKLKPQTSLMGFLRGADSAYCPKCKAITRQKMCPACARMLPMSILDTKSLLVSIVGVSGAGKSNYITVMLDELEKAGNLKLPLSSADEDTRKTQRYKRDQLYEQHTVLEATLAEETITPLLYNLRNINRKFGDHIPSYAMTIFDGAGENMERGAVHMDSVHRFIALSGAIIFLLDPMILESVRNDLDEDIIFNSSSSSGWNARASTEVVDEIATLIRMRSSRRTNRLINVPIAVVFSKMDALLPTFSNCTVKKPSPHVRKGYFSRSDHAAVHLDIWNWLESRGEGEFINALESSFSNFKFFGVSSFGGVPENGRIGEIRPHRVLDPVLWLLAEEGIIDAR